MTNFLISEISIMHYNGEARTHTKLEVNQKQCFQFDITHFAWYQKFVL